MMDVFKDWRDAATDAEITARAQENARLVKKTLAAAKALEQTEDYAERQRKRRLYDEVYRAELARLDSEEGS